MEPVRKHWHWKRRLERKSRNAETLFNAFIVFKAFNKLHCLYCPSLPSLSFCAFYILQCPSVQKAELWALRACFFWKLPLLLIIKFIIIDYQVHDSWLSNAWCLKIKCMMLDDQMHYASWSNARQIKMFVSIKHHQALSSMLYDA